MGLEVVHTSRSLGMDLRTVSQSTSPRFMTANPLTGIVSNTARRATYRVSSWANLGRPLVTER